MPNHIAAVEKLVKEMRLGWPSGTYDLYKEIPTLVARIEELEAALVPFARVAAAEGNNPFSSAENLVHVYLKHCMKALEMVDSSRSVPVRVDDFFSVPAEG